MKLRTIRMLLVLTLTFTLLGFYSRSSYAASCSGNTCVGKDPQTMGCGADAVTSGSAKTLIYYENGNPVAYGFVETRKSDVCSAKWARTTNYSGGPLYAAATIRYGTNYGSTQNVRSPGTIGNWAVVYTPMTYYTSTKSCGALGASLISIPLALNSNYCTTAN